MKNIFFQRYVLGALFFLLLLSVSATAIAFNETGGGNGNIISQPESGYIFTGGVITSLTQFSIILSSGANVQLNSGTVCKIPVKNSNGGQPIDEENIVPCSSLFKGETVRVKAVKDNSGQILAVTVEEVFF